MSAAPIVSVMVVDDDQDIREILDEVLTRARHSVVTASNGATALDLLKSVRPRVILLDLNMPVMDGFEFLRIRKSDRAIAQIPTVIMSALHRMRERIADLAVDDVLEKPVDLDHLLRVVKHHCESDTTTGAP